MSPRIGLAFEGDVDDPASWSGCVLGLRRGLEQSGAEVVPIRAIANRPWRRLVRSRRTYAQEAASPSNARATSAAAQRSLARAGGLDGIVQVGSGYELDPTAPLVTYEDMTVAQAARLLGPVRDLAPALLDAWIERQGRIYGYAKRCCVFAAWAGESIQRDYAVAPDRVAVVGAGRTAAVVEVDRRWDPPRFLFVGREWERKGGPEVVAAFERVTVDVPGARLDVVGGHPPVVADGVSTHGSLRLDQPDDQRVLADLRAAATVFVMPSHFEPFGIAYLEAGAAGVASIGTTVGGAAEAIGPGGVVVEPGDVDALADAMTRLADPQCARTLGEAAREQARPRTWAHTGAKVLQALEVAA